MGINTIPTSDNTRSNAAYIVFENPNATPLHVYWYKMWQVSKLSERFLVVKGFKNINKTLYKTNALVPSRVYLSGTVTLKMQYSGYRH